MHRTDVLEVMPERIAAPTNRTQVIQRQAVSLLTELSLHDVPAATKPQAVTAACNVLFVLEALILCGFCLQFV
jgi:hypothetical protein